MHIQSEDALVMLASQMCTLVKALGLIVLLEDEEWFD